MVVQCTANDVVTIVYIINDTAASDTDIMNKGFHQLGTESLDTQVTRRNLSVTVSSLYNNTDILCRAFGTDMNVNSNTATPTVQGNTHVHDNQKSLLSLISGPLSSVDGLSYSYLILSLIPLLSISHGVHHSLYLVHISLDITYQ